MKFLINILISLFLFSAIQAQNDPWLTFYEQSGMKATPRYSETIDFLKRLDQESDQLSLGSFGTSPQQRDLVYAVYDHDGFTDPDKIRSKGRIILMVEACIHSGESEGKDAMLVLLRDLVIRHQHEDLFKNVSLLFIPIFNVDGHERFGKFGRINQNGPSEMGWRTTAQNLNLNRDFLKADAPEMRAWLKLYNQWLPEFFIDTHTTDGADYQYVLTYGIETSGNMDQNLTDWQKNIYLPAVTLHMDNQQMPIFPYVYFRNWHDPRSGLISGVAGPMFSQGYTAMRNRPGLLIETHMLKAYQPRVESTKEMILATLSVLAKEYNHLSKLIQEADAYTVSKEFRHNDFPLHFQTDMTDSSQILFKGIEYVVDKSDLTGGDWFKYDNTKAVDMYLPIFEKVNPTSLIHLPEAYIIPAEWQDIIERLKLHGIKMIPIENEETKKVEIYVFTKNEWQKTPYEGRFRMSKIKYDKKVSMITYSTGSVIVPMDQPLAKIIAHMLEPDGNGSFLEWGFFNQIFEQKEYAESYVMEPLARKMLDSIPGLRTEYEHKMQSDSLFAKDSWEQLNWFYSKTPWWDTHYKVYPIGRIMK
ncbi:MAG: M14 family metallopeptidase [Bacteroidales bacterium]